MPNIFILPKRWRKFVAYDKIVKIYFNEKIQRECQSMVHERIMSQTSKMHDYELSLMFNKLSFHVEKQADRMKISVKEVQRAVVESLELKDSLKEVVDYISQKFQTYRSPQSSLLQSEGDNYSEISSATESIDLEQVTKDAQKRQSKIQFPSLPTINGVDSKQDYFKSRVHIDKKKLKMEAQPIKRKVLRTQNSIQFIQDYTKNLKSDDLNMYRLLQILHEGLIDKEKVLDFDIDTYFKKLLKANSQKGEDVYRKMLEFHDTLYERRQARMLPFERRPKKSKVRHEKMLDI